MLLSFLVNFSPFYLVSHTSNVCEVTADVSGYSIPNFTSRHLFTLKAIIAPTGGIVLFVWCIVKAKGIGPILSQPATIHGSDLGWAMVVSITICISAWSTLIM